jgi:PhzF family phenazine biosynthesis protein
METKSVLLVDAFADEPLGGSSVPVVPGDVTRPQLRSIASEFGASGAVTYEDDSLVYVQREPAHALVEAAVGGWTGLLEADEIESGTGTLTAVSADGTERRYPIEGEGERDVRVELAEEDIEQSDVPDERVAPALGMEAAAIADIREELPVSRIDSFGGTLFVPVAFLDSLSNCSPDRETLHSLLGETETARVCAFTFDTLGRRSDLHVRVFDSTTTDCERPTSGVAIGGCGQYLSHHAAFDGDIDEIRVECGHFADRPATVESTLEPTPSVGGQALTVLDGTVSVPPADDDDIIEV